MEISIQQTNCLTPIRIALDLDDCLTSFYDSYKEKFKADKNPKVLENNVITKNVVKLKTNKAFWLGLRKISNINFIPELYATKRINPKSWSRQWLINNGFPNRPIYQMVLQDGNKADMIKGRCDVLIDDSETNVRKALKSGLPALLLDKPYNRNATDLKRIYSLDINEINKAFYEIQHKS